MYLEASLSNIDKMPQSTYDEVIEKYVEMNIAHPFREGNGRTTRLFFDSFAKVNGWDLGIAQIPHDEFVAAMIESMNSSLERLEDAIGKVLTTAQR